MTDQIENVLIDTNVTMKEKQSSRTRQAKYEWIQ